MRSKATIVVFAICIAALGAAGYLYHLSHPSYSSTHFDDSYFTIDYPSTWEAPEINEKNQYDNQTLDLSNEQFHHDWEYAKGFDTAWDKEQDVAFSVWCLPGNTRGWNPDPKQLLIDRYRKQHPRSFGQDEIAPPGLKPVTFAGHDGWGVTEKYEPETLDIITLKGPSLNPFKLTYWIFFGGEMSQTTLVFSYGKGRLCQVQYVLPGDKIARARYERVFGRILDSLKIKGS